LDYLINWLLHCIASQHYQPPWNPCYIKHTIMNLTVMWYSVVIKLWIANNIFQQENLNSKS
jgi:hypothetical protein